MSNYRIPNVPFCTRCNASIDPEIAVPVFDSQGLEVPGIYRDWCIYHWSRRSGALPVDHPNFLKPNNPMTKLRDKVRRGVTPANTNASLLSQLNNIRMQRGQPSFQELPTGGDTARTPRDVVNQSEEPARIRVPYHSEALNILDRARGRVTLFPGLEAVASYLSKMSHEELEDMWNDIGEQTPHE